MIRVTWIALFASLATLAAAQTADIGPGAKPMAPKKPQQATKPGMVRIIDPKTKKVIEVPAHKVKKSAVKPAPKPSKTTSKPAGKTEKVAPKAPPKKASTKNSGKG